jgi:hypothetical protein
MVLYYTHTAKVLTVLYTVLYTVYYTLYYTLYAYTVLIHYTHHTF